jgi:hypothetical protein
MNRVLERMLVDFRASGRLGILDFSDFLDGGRSRMAVEPTANK